MRERFEHRKRLVTAATKMSKSELDLLQALAAVEGKTVSALGRELLARAVVDRLAEHSRPASA